MARGDSLLRQWQLLNFLQKSRRGMSLRDLSALAGYSERTIQRDLKLLADAGFPVTHETNDYGKRFWRLPADFLHREGLVLSVTEAVGLYFARQLLSPLQGTEFAEGLDSIIGKIRGMLPETALDHFKALTGLILVRGKGQTDYSRHKQTIQALSNAVRTQRIALVTYKSVWRGETYEAAVHPYGMVYFEGDLYMVGHSERAREIRLFKIARVLGVEMTNIRFHRPAHFSLDELFQGSFGIMPTEGQEREVIAEFHPRVAVLIEERQWHPSQKLERTDAGWLRAIYLLKNTTEFKRWILGFGPYARVLQPPSLRRELAETLKAAIAIYEDSELLPAIVPKVPLVNRRKSVPSSDGAGSERNRKLPARAV